MRTPFDELFHDEFTADIVHEKHLCEPNSFDLLRRANEAILQDRKEYERKCKVYDDLVRESNAFYRELVKLRANQSSYVKERDEARVEAARLRAALTEIYEEPNQLGYLAYEAAEEYGIKAWDIALAALENKNV